MEITVGVYDREADSNIFKNSNIGKKNLTVIKRIYLQINLFTKNQCH